MILTSRWPFCSQHWWLANSLGRVNGPTQQPMNPAFHLWRKNPQLLQRFGREGTIQIEFPAPKANLYLKISSADASVAEEHSCWDFSHISGDDVDGDAAGGGGWCDIKPLHDWECAFLRCLARMWHKVYIDIYFFIHVLLIYICGCWSTYDRLTPGDRCLEFWKVLPGMERKKTTPGDLFFPRA